MITRNRTLGIVFIAVASLVLTSSLVQAQSGAQGFGARRAKSFSNRAGSSQFSSSAFKNRVTNSSLSRDNRFVRPNLGSYTPPSSSRSSKPFSSVTRSPAVSPYLALNNSFNQVSDYYNIVRPQREQRRVNQQLLRQNQTNQRRLNQMAAQGPYSPKGNENSAPTGHAAVFQSLGTYLNTGGYYAGPPAPRRQ